MERLQKAVEATIAAGYQLDKEAFEFLKIIAATQDPIKVVNRALERMESQKEKALFIGRNFLEALMKDFEELEGKIAPQKEPPQQLLEPRMSEGKTAFHPYAQGIEAKLSVLEDISKNLGSEGTVEDYLEYFRDRFRRMEKLLRQRIDAKGAASIIDALKSSANTRLKIVCMVTDKRESKQRVVLAVEDLQANAVALVPQTASQELLTKARSLLPDQVVCLAVVKTRSDLLIVEDIILPDISQRQQRKAPLPIYAVLTSDMHVGSVKFQKEMFNRFVLWLNGKYGNEKMREIASHVKYVLIAGDIVDGIGIYPNQIKELALRDIHKQYMLASKCLEQIPDYIEVVIIPGNHDAPRKALPQPAISNTFLKTLQETKKIHSFGNPCLLSLHGVEMLLYHGRGLDDIVHTAPKMDTPEEAMKLLLQSRHLAPIYGGKTMLSPEKRDFLVIERVPDVFHAGHVHILGHTNYRGVLIINSGCWQAQTEYMKRMGVVPTPGKVPVVNLQTLEVTILSFD
ncbi:MAG: DNA-directed DNA polymerase II small subunit [Candidatus Bathycorpusculaceae bacterium]